MRRGSAAPWRDALTTLALGLVLVAGVLATGEGTAAESRTNVSIRGTSVYVNDVITNKGSAAEGLLLNSRMVQAVFDDANPSTVGEWAYPDTAVWDAQRNVDEFVSAIPSYAAKGLDGVTIGLQGGNPVPGPAPSGAHPWNVTAFNSDGSLKTAWLARLDKAIGACDAHGVVVVLSLFYQGQDQRITDEGAVLRGVDSVVDWVLQRGYGNVLIEVANEVNHGGFDHAILSSSRVDELILRVQTRSSGRLAASTSFLAGAIPPDDVLRVADYVLVHGNNRDAAEIASMIAAIRSKASYQGNPTPIIFNEDSTDLRNLDAAVAKSASWGYHDKGNNDYVNGFQAPPVNWNINTSEKRAFFERVAQLTGAPLPTPSPNPGAYSIVHSSSSTRSSPEPLSGGVVKGDVFAFVTPEEGVERTRFWLDGVLVQTEHNPPWDFRGGSTSTAQPFDTTQVENGVHAIEAVLDLSSGATTTTRTTFEVANGTIGSLRYEPPSLELAVEQGQIAQASVKLTTDDGAASTFTVTVDADWLRVTPTSGPTNGALTLTVDSSSLGLGTHTAHVDATSEGHASARLPVTVSVLEPPYRLLFSTASDRSNALALEGSIVRGALYVFVSTKLVVSRAAFWLDDPTRAGPPRRLELNSPWDFAGGNEVLAYPFATSALENGKHTITAELLLADGQTHVVHSSFTIEN